MNDKAIGKVRDARMRYETARRSNAMLRQRREEYTNILLTYADDLLDAADECKQYEEQLNLEIAAGMKVREELAQLKSVKASKSAKGETGK